MASKRRDFIQTAKKAESLGNEICEKLCDEDESGLCACSPQGHNVYFDREGRLVLNETGPGSQTMCLDEYHTKKLLLWLWDVAPELFPPEFRRNIAANEPVR